MKRALLGSFAAALLSLAASTTFGEAAEGEARVKAALLDMSAVMPTGMMSYGIMAPGMMMGQGTMGQGQRTAPGMMGPGMMGGMGRIMTIQIDQPIVKAGKVTFDVTNWSRSIAHELLVIAVNSPTAPLPYDHMQAKVPESQIKVLGETGDLQPNASGAAALTLDPGTYLLICNVPGHYAAGMAAPITVMP
jgi:uncharacterized cupredoxin-like copper-binding protein